MQDECNSTYCICDKYKLQFIHWFSLLYTLENNKTRIFSVLHTQKNIQVQHENSDDDDDDDDDDDNNLLSVGFI